MPKLGEDKPLRQLFLAVALLLAAFGATAEPATHDYAVGQVWNYRTRPEDAGSLIRIGGIEDGANGPIYHIGVIGMHMPGMDTATSIGHLPVSRQTLDMSVTTLAKTNAAFPDMTGGIAQWRNAHGGVYTISIADIMRTVAQTLGANAGSGKP